MRKEEHFIQKSVANALSWAGIEFYAVPNGGLRNVKVAAQLKEEGVKPGVADMVLLLPGGESVYVEIKTADGVQSLAQKEFQRRITKLGFTYLIWRSIDDALQFIKGLRRMKNV